MARRLNLPGVATLTETGDEKQALRKILRLRRDALAISLRLEAALKLTTCDLSFTGLTSGTVSGFYPFGSEIDGRPFLGKLRTLGFVTALPVIIKPAAPLVFRSWVPGDPLVKGVWDIPVPTGAAKNVVPDILLVPLLGFDDAGYRIGYGGGYYDRTLAYLKKTKKIVSIGLAYAAQHVSYLPRERHDIALDWVLTEQGPRKFSP